MVEITQSATNARIWTFSSEIIPVVNKTNFKVSLTFAKNCILPRNKYLNTVQFQGNFGGYINLTNNTSIPLAGVPSPYLTFDWDPKLITFTFNFKLKTYNNIFFFGTIKDGCEIWDECFWVNLIDGECTTFTSAFAGASSEAACAGASALCESLWIIAGGGPEDPFADEICTSTCTSAEEACVTLVEQGVEVSASAICSEMGI